MRIGIDARMMGKGFGLARYTEQLVLHSLKVDSTNEFVLFLRKDNWDQIPDTTPRVKKVLADIPWYSVQEQLQLIGIIKKEKVDLMHFPHWNIPYFYRQPYVVTIHDLIMFHFPRAQATTLGPVKFWVKDMAHRLLLRKISKNAKHIFATSEFTRSDIHATLHVPLEKMTVTYQAPFEVIQNMDDINHESLLAQYNINKPYILYVGAAYPHKNLRRLIDAWKLYEQKYASTHQLVLVGKENYFYSEIKKYQQAVAPESHVLFTGFVPDEELSVLYEHASLYVFPSLYEGFGLPPLEAMVHGVPVVSSNQSCLPEVLGNAALYFDPQNRDEMVEKIHSGLTDILLRENLKIHSKKILQKYSWETLASQTINVYRCP